jgi:hypothetical protein
LIRLTLCVESCRTAEIDVAVPSGLGVVPIASVSFTNTIGGLRAGRGRPLELHVRPPGSLAGRRRGRVRDVAGGARYARRKLAGPHGAITAGTVGLAPDDAAAGVETQFVALSTVIEIG